MLAKLRTRWSGTIGTDGAIYCANILAGILVARALGPEDRGTLTAVIIWAHAAAGYFSLALNEAAAVLIASGKVGRERLQASLAWLTLGLSALIVIVAVPLLPWLMGEERAHAHGVAQLYLALFVPSSLLAMNLLALDQGVLDFRRFNWLRLLQAALYPIILVVLWALDAVNIASAAGALLTSTVVSALVRLHLSGWRLSWPDGALVRALLEKGGRIHLVNLAIFVGTDIDKLILVLLGDDRNLGIYVVALSAAGAAQGIVVQSASQIVLPTLARGEEPDASAVLKGFRQLLGLLGAANMALFLLLPWLLPLLYGQPYAPAIAVAQILLLALMARGVKRILIYALRARSANRPAILAETATVAIFPALAWPAYAVGGLSGLAWALVVANGVGLLLLIWAISQKYSLAWGDWLGWQADKRETIAGGRR